MKKLIVMWIVCALLFGGLGLMACGGGGQETEQEVMSESGDEMVVAEAEDEKKEEKGEGDWGDIPIYSGADRAEEELTAKMGASGSAISEVRLYKTGDAYDKVVSFYKSRMSRKGWTKIMDKEDEEGWGSMWQKKDGQQLVNVSVVKDIDGQCGIVIGRHKEK
jgi:hypothetical protein